MILSKSLVEVEDLMLRGMEDVCETPELQGRERKGGRDVCGTEALGCLATKERKGPDKENMQFKKNENQNQNQNRNISQ